jgi:hypothetical protein
MRNQLFLVKEWREILVSNRAFRSGANDAVNADESSFREAMRIRRMRRKALSRLCEGVRRCGTTPGWNGSCRPTRRPIWRSEGKSSSSAHPRSRIPVATPCAGSWNGRVEPQPVQSPGEAAVFAAFEQGGQVFLVLEETSGTPLEATCRRVLPEGLTRDPLPSDWSRGSSLG